MDLETQSSCINYLVSNGFLTYGLTACDDVPFRLTGDTTGGHYAPSDMTSHLPCICPDTQLPLHPAHLEAVELSINHSTVRSELGRL